MSNSIELSSDTSSNQLPQTNKMQEHSRAHDPVNPEDERPEATAGPVQPMNAGGKSRKGWTIQTSELPADEKPEHQ